MATPRLPDQRDDLMLAPASAGNLPGTLHSGMIFLEYVNVERKVSGVWTAISTDTPTAFEPVAVERRIVLETWTHKPLFTAWFPPDASIQDADRLIRSDASHWYVRGSALLSPDRTHMVVLVEAAAEDDLFAARSASEPS